MPGAIINADTTVGDGVIVNTGATIDHDCVLASFCHIAPGSNIAGCVRVGTGAFLGTGTKVIPRVWVGEWSVTGAGTTIIADLPREVLAVGVPARIIRSFSRK